MAEEKKQAEEIEVKEEKKAEIPEKFKKVVDEIAKMSVLDLSELVKVLEEKFGVSAAAPAAMVAAAAPGAQGEGGGAEAAEKTDFDVELTASGDAKIAVIKLVREITGQGLKEAKDMVDAAPKVIKAKVAKSEAEELKKKLEEVGATVTLK
ncbi:50S ribosomal protein L7/L12 [bacterium (Candidatus Torokbacteria) CG09_land_8_20_14_0_10_42_11]|nr:MAG: 50S ribosomal protein L7/L12 [bacterium (Candidatus Torokbacteria) CG09_land_8_20_14_0_10_42_11]